MTDEHNKPIKLTAIEQAILDDVTGQADADAASNHTDRTETSAPEIRKPTGHESIYAWMMFDTEHGWNIIGMRMLNGTTLPMVTTDLHNAWSLFAIAQAHANANGVQCRLAGWAHPDVIAIVDPEVARGGDDG
jgi:hypothetical protein